jgi:nicotinamidase-related amidase
VEACWLTANKWFLKHARGSRALYQRSRGNLLASIGRERGEQDLSIGLEALRVTKKALLVIDMTNDFLLKSYNPGLALESAMTLVPKIRELQEAFLDAGHPVIYTTDRHLKSDFELKRWGPHSMKGTKGSEIVKGLNTKGKYVLERDWKKKDIKRIEKDQLLFEVEKGSYSGFTDNGGVPTAMDSLLEQLKFKPGDRLYLTGIHTNCCDKHTAADAWFRGYVPVMVRDCTTAFEDKDGTIGMGHDRALNYEKHWYDAKIESSAQVVKELK